VVSDLIGVGVGIGIGIGIDRVYPGVHRSNAFVIPFDPDTDSDPDADSGSFKMPTGHGNPASVG